VVITKLRVNQYNNKGKKMIVACDWRISIAKTKVDKYDTRNHGFRSSSKNDDVDTNSGNDLDDLENPHETQ
jgi:hypothetical protein